MNDTTPPQDAPSGDAGEQARGDAHQQRSSGSFFTWLRGLGISRGGDRWLAGVASGIAAKAGIDPLIVRGVFVVLAVLGGPGILLYIAGWLLLPDQLGRIHVEDLFRGRASAGVTVTIVIIGAVLVLPLLLWAIPASLVAMWSWGPTQWLPDWAGGIFTWLWWIAVVVAIWWAIVWIVRSSKSPEQRQAAAEWGKETGERAAAWGEQAGQRAAAWGEEFGQKAEAWGQRVEEKSRDWEKWGEEHHRRHSLGAGHVVLTLAMALLAAGGVAALALSIPVHTDLVLTGALLAAVGVLSVSMIIAGVRGRDSGWIGFLAFCGVVALVLAPFTKVLPADTRITAFGNYTLQSQPEDSDKSVLMLAGSTVVDLTELRERDDARVIEVWQIFGNTRVELNGSSLVVVQASLLGGNVSADDNAKQSGLFVSRTVSTRDVTSESSGVTEVRVHTLFGNVRIDGSNLKDEDRAPSALAPAAPASLAAHTHLMNAEYAR